MNYLPFDFANGYNTIAPSQVVLIVLHDKETLLVLARWGFIPAWEDDLTTGQHVINVRSKTVSDGQPSGMHSSHNGVLFLL